MRRREFLTAMAGGLGAAAVPGRARAAEGAGPGGGALKPPAKGVIHVAFAISEGVNVMDLAGPWEVFEDVMIPERGPSMDEQMPFRPFTVSQTRKPLKSSGGLVLTPSFTFDDCPRPQVVVVPAQAGTPRMSEWLRAVSKVNDVTMSVCTGAFKLGEAGLLAGRAATTHHDYLEAFAKQFPDVRVERGVRLVDEGRIATAAGLTSGIDLALRVVERYFGKGVSEATARYLEYERRERRG
jgi:transcriptional regulator GlxA family with amidase domain